MPSSPARPALASVHDLTLDTLVSDFAREESRDLTTRLECRRTYLDALASVGGTASSISHNDWAIELTYTLSIRQFLAWPRDGYDPTELARAILENYPELEDAPVYRGMDSESMIEEQVEGLYLQTLPPEQFRGHVRALLPKRPVVAVGALRGASPEQLAQITTTDLQLLMQSEYDPARDEGFRVLGILALQRAPASASRDSRPSPRRGRSRS